MSFFFFSFSYQKSFCKSRRLYLLFLFKSWVSCLGRKLSMYCCNFWCLCCSWYLVGGMHHGRAAEGKSPLSRQWLYPSSARSDIWMWRESTALYSLFFSPYQPTRITSKSSVDAQQSSHGFALQSQAFLRGRRISRERQGWMGKLTKDRII